MVARPWSSSRLSSGERLLLRCDGNPGNSFPTKQERIPHLELGGGSAPSHLPPHNISVGHPHAPAPSMLYPASDIDWRFNSHDSIHVRMSFSQIIPPSPSLSESKSPLYTSVSFFLSCIQGRLCHLSKFHMYVLVYCIGVFLSGLLHSV